jgi:hypothetical protein
MLYLKSSKSEKWNREAWNSMTTVLVLDWLGNVFQLGYAICLHFFTNHRESLTLYWSIVIFDSLTLSLIVPFTIMAFDKFERTQQYMLLTRVGRRSNKLELDQSISRT